MLFDITLKFENFPPSCSTRRICALRSTLPPRLKEDFDSVIVTFGLHKWDCGSATGRLQSGFRDCATDYARTARGPNTGPKIAED